MNGKIKQLLEEGEGQFVEFKENIDKALAKEIVAFANATGGKIYLGIDDKNTVKGIETTNRLKSQVIDIAKNCDPKIHIALEKFENLLVVNVPESINKPHQCKEGFHLRLGANSQKLTRDEIIKFCIRENKIRFDEQICKDFDFADFDDEKFEYYMKLARISNTLDKKELLRNIRALTADGMTNAGALFFAKEPYKYIMTSRIRCVLFKGNERVRILDKKEVDKGIIGNIEYAVNYLDEHVPVRFEIRGLYRKEFPQFPQDAYREAIVNSVIHRDYFENGEVAVEKFQNFIYVNNPGGVVSSLSKKDFGTLSWPRNRLLADLLSRTYLMEKAGTGIKRIKDASLENKNIVEFRDRETYFFTVFENKESPSTVEKTSEKIIGLIKLNPLISANEIAETIGKTSRAVELQISKLKKDGLLERI